MYFCPNCDTVFDITKLNEQVGDSTNNSISESISVSSELKLGGASKDIDMIIQKILNGDPLNDDDILDITTDTLLKNNSYKKLKPKQKELVYNTIQDLLPIKEKQILNEEGIKPTNEKAYFKCKNCGFLKPISDETLIFSRVSTDIAQSYATSDFKDMVYSDILHRTRKYDCPNDKCESHQTPSKREAVFFRRNNTFKVTYICTTCHTSF